MITKFLANLNDPQEPLLARSIWVLKKSGLILPKSTIYKIFHLLLHSLTVFFVITQVIELFSIGSNLDLVLTNVKILMVSSITVGKQFSLLFWHNRWKEVFEYISEADKFERNTKDPVKMKILNFYTKYCGRFFYFYWSLVFLTIITVTNTPLIFMSSKKFRGELKNGTVQFPHIFSAWVPVDKYHFPGSWYAVIWHVYICTYGAIIIGAYDTTVHIIMIFIGGKLDLLREHSKNVFGKGGAGLNNAEAFKSIRQLHDMHNLLTKHFRIFNSLLSPVMFLYVVVCSLALCASAYQLTMVSSTTQKLLMAEFLMFGIAQLFLFCWHSNYVLIKSQNVMCGPYESAWWAGTVPQRKAILLLTGQFRRNYNFKAGPFSNLSLSSFMKIIKGAYSFYTILRK